MLRFNPVPGNAQAADWERFLSFRGHSCYCTVDMSRPWEPVHHYHPACSIVNIKLLELKKKKKESVTNFLGNSNYSATGLLKLLWKFFYLKEGAGHSNVFMYCVSYEVCINC